MTSEAGNDRPKHLAGRRALHARTRCWRVATTLVAAVALVALPQTAHARGVAPQLGSISSVGLNASFQPSHTVTAAEADTLARRSNWVITSEGRTTPEIRNRMRTVNPDLQIAAYESITGARPHEAAAAPECQARTADGARLLSISYGTILMDPGCARWRARVVEHCQELLANGWDRCYLDVLGPGEYSQLFYAEGDDLKRVAHPDVPLMQWQARKRELVRAMVASTGRTIWANCLINGAWWTLAEVRESGCIDPTLVQWSMAEGFSRGLSVYAVDRDLLLNSPVPVYAVCKQYEVYDPVQEFRCLSMFAMYGDNDMVQTVMKGADPTVSLGPAAGGLLRLGRPTGPPTLDPVSRMLIRPFTCGYALIREAPTPAFGGGWTVPGTATYTTWNGSTFRGGSKVLANGWNGNGLVRAGCVP